MNLSLASILFGVFELKINHVREAALIYKYLAERGFISQYLGRRPSSKFQMSGFVLLVWMLSSLGYWMKPRLS